MQKKLLDSKNNNFWYARKRKPSVQKIIFGCWKILKLVILSSISANVFAIPYRPTSSWHFALAHIWIIIFRFTCELLHFANEECSLIWINRSHFMRAAYVVPRSMFMCDFRHVVRLLIVHNERTIDLECKLLPPWKNHSQLIYKTYWILCDGRVRPRHCVFDGWEHAVSMGSNRWRGFPFISHKYLARHIIIFHIMNVVTIDRPSIVPTVCCGYDVIWMQQRHTALENQCQRNKWKIVFCDGKQFNGWMEWRGARAALIVDMCGAFSLGPSFFSIR